MASPNTRVALDRTDRLKSLPVFGIMNDVQRRSWLQKANTLPEGWDRKPSSGQIFTNVDDCHQRLNSWGFIEGCLYVKIRTRLSGTPNWTFACKYHSDKTQNNRELEPLVQRDKDGTVSSKRKRDTLNHRLGCPVEYRLSYKLSSTQGFDLPIRSYIGQWRSEEHSHPIPLNPFIFPEHRRGVEEYEEVEIALKKYRLAHQPYSKALELLKQDKLGVVLGSKEYYNLIRREKGSDDPRSIVAMLQLLQEEGFSFRTMTKDRYEEADPTQIVSRKLLQIVFWSQAGLLLAQRFCPGHVLIIDGTFNTNAKRLPLLVAVGVTNAGKTFPIALSYCLGETAEAYCFFFDTLRAEFFTNGIPEPAVVLADQAVGLISAVDTYGTLPNSRLQFCSWHAVEAILAALRKRGRYSSKDLDGDNDTPGIKDLVNWYIYSGTIDTLQINRQNLLDRLHESDHEYITQTWEPKESRVIRCYTQFWPNLACYATSRVESSNHVLKQVVNAQMSLKDSVRAITGKLSSWYTRLEGDEVSALTNRATALDLSVFRNLVGSTSLVAIAKVEEQWLQLCQIREAQEDLGSCCCTILTQFSLPCRHVLTRAYDRQQAIPLSLIHPRWWLRGPPITNWTPSYDEPTLILSPRRTTLHTAFYGIIESRERLGQEERSRFDEQVLQTTRNLEAISYRHQQLQQIPIGQPDTIPKKTWKRKDNKVEARALTANEVAMADEQRARRQAAQQERDNRIQIARQEAPIASSATITTPTTPPPTSTILSTVLVPSTPPPPVLASPQTPSFDIDDILCELPSSTAPPILGRGQRERKRTAKKQEAVNRGWLPNSQHKE